MGKQFSINLVCCGIIENREATEVRNERRSKRFEMPELFDSAWRESTVRGDNDPSKARTL